MEKSSFEKIMIDYHVHIGQYFDLIYDYHDVFSIIVENGVRECYYAYLTPRFTESREAIFFAQNRRMIDEDAVAYAESIGLKAHPLFWVDPVIIDLPTFFSDYLCDGFYQGVAIHPFLHKWKNDDDRTIRLFEFLSRNLLPVYIHTGCSGIDSPDFFESMFARFPNVEVHLAHCRDAATVIRLFKKYVNIFGDTAFCPRESYNAIVEAGFKERMKFGTDFPITHWFERKEENSEVRREDLSENYRKTLLYHEFDLYNSDLIK